MKKNSVNFLCIRGVPEELKHRFKLACVRNERSMRDAVVDLLTAYCDMDEASLQRGPDTVRDPPKWKPAKR